ncbi:MAG: sensor histidine kinase [Chloroflexi bacterium]|jgi:two-component system, NarL family, sensor histidine kinase DegS|nr:sensor histidine kinase [Chloroflexota bacterium]MBT7081651.1 sensor histidine kinase [Chloroflexota bacterium]MBT7289324.1 sensor histidine kinase [Chloroflexota bacterium]
MIRVVNFVKDLRITATKAEFLEWIKRWQLWLAFLIIVGATIPQYSDSLNISDNLLPWRLIGFERHTVERIFYLVPIAYGAITIGIRTGMLLSVISFCSMLPRVFPSQETLDTLFEVLLVTALGFLFCLFRKIQIDMKEQKERDLLVVRKMQENQHFYIRQAVMAQEEERKRISRELHDDTVQVLGGLSRKLDNFIRKNASLTKDDLSFLKDLHEQLNAGLTEVQRFSQDLRPSLLDYLGLFAALRSLVNKASEHYGLPIEFEIFGGERRLPPESEILIFRIIQEALSNIGRHAHATTAKVKIESLDGKTSFCITDDGCGFDLPESVTDLPRGGQLGLAGISERVLLMRGELNVQSAVGIGTTISVEIPD